jgi:hypothetical protein
MVVWRLRVGCVVAQDRYMMLLRGSIQVRLRVFVCMLVCDKSLQSSQMYSLWVFDGCMGVRCCATSLRDAVAGQHSGAALCVFICCFF